MEHLYSVTPLLEDHFEERGMKNVYMYNDLLTSVANRDKKYRGASLIRFLGKNL